MKTGHGIRPRRERPAGRISAASGPFTLSMFAAGMVEVVVRQHDEVQLRFACASLASTLGAISGQVWAWLGVAVRSGHLWPLRAGVGLAYFALPIPLRTDPGGDGC